jgi:hypothetical protein
MSPDTLVPIGPSAHDGITGPHMTARAAAVVAPDEIAVVEGLQDLGGATLEVFAFDPQGAVLTTNFAGASGNFPIGSPADTFTVSWGIAGQSGAGAMVVVNWFDSGFPNGNIPPNQTAYFEALPLNGSSSGLQPLSPPLPSFDAVAFPGPTGFHLEWLTPTDVGSTQTILWQEDFTAAGVPVDHTLTSIWGSGVIPYAGVTLNGAAFVIEDNIATLNGSFAGFVPGEPAHAMTQAAAAALTDGTHAAVGWVDSGTDYVSLFDAATDSFGPVIGLDWGGASDIHVLALPDGGFAASWMNGGAYKGEVFAADGTGGGIIPLAGDVSGVSSGGNLYTIDSNFNVQQYAIQGGQSVSTSAATYTAPAGVQTIYLTGSSQIVTGNASGDVFWSNDTGNAMIGGAGNDVFHIGRGGDWVLGNGGDDVFQFSGVPWAGAHIYGFTSGDVVDLTAMMSTVDHEPSIDPFSSGFLKFTDDGSGDAQIWANYQVPGNDVFWLVATLSGVSSSSLHYDHALIT